MNLTNAIDQFLTRMAAEGKSPHTIACYRRDLEMLAAFAGDVEISALTDHVG